MSEAIRGMDKLTAQLYAIADGNYVPALAKGVEEAIFPEMQRLTPVDTGRLKSSERVDVTESAVTIIADTEYAVFVEMGTSRMAAQPYMRPAIDAKRDEAMKITANEISAEMKRLANG